MKKSVAILLYTFLLGISAFAKSRSFDTDVKSTVKGNNQFAFEFYHQLRKSEKGNIFMSPYSISTALAMTYAGARNNTAAEMKATMHYLDAEPTAAAFGALQKGLTADPKKDGFQLSLANALWGQEGYKFLAEFEALNKKYYGAGMNRVNFGQPEAARTTINTWVEKQTQEKIKDLIKQGDLDKMVKLVLTNAIYFKGDWEGRFDEKLTKEADFHAPGGAVKAQMMYRKGALRYADSRFMPQRENLPGFQMIELPYKGKKLSMVVILPKKKDGLADVEQAVNATSLGMWLKAMRGRDVQVHFPRFKIAGDTINLNQQLQALGMKDAFDMAADFSGMDGTKKLYISKVLHKAFVEVNETGTEAAAATAVIMRTKSAARPRHMVFRADRPFLFLIRDNQSGSILFMGRLTNPGK